MIHDLFLRRYPQQIYWADRPSPEIHNLFVQVAHIIFGDLVEPLRLEVDLLAPWEGDMLKAYFVHVRNPHGHGAGSQPPPALTLHQTEWAIETAMAWIKNLVRRS